MKNLISLWLRRSVIASFSLAQTSGAMEKSQSVFLTGQCGFCCPRIFVHRSPSLSASGMKWRTWKPNTKPRLTKGLSLDWKILGKSRQDSAESLAPVRAPSALLPPWVLHTATLVLCTLSNCVPPPPLPGCSQKLEKHTLSVTSSFASGYFCVTTLQKKFKQQLLRRTAHRCFS